jgi:hypothetical protein
MTFKLTIGDRLTRDARAAAPRSASDLVRDFRQRLREDAAAKTPPRRAGADVTLLDRTRGPRMSTRG